MELIAEKTANNEQHYLTLRIGTDTFCHKAFSEMEV